MTRPRIKLDNLLAVSTVAERHDYGRAADELGLTASAVRKQIETVEGLLGVRLFDGKKGNLTLTEDGDIFEADAKRSIEHALLAEEKVLMRLALRNHHLHIGHSTYLPPQLITLIRRIGIEGQPPVHLDHVSGLTSNLVQRVLEGSLHAAVVLLPVSSPELLIRPVFEEPVVVCLGSGHRLAAKSVIYPQDLASEPVIAVAREPFPELHKEIEEHFEGFGISLNVVAEAFAPPEALTLVAQRVGICLIAASSAVQRPGITVKPLSTKVLMRRSGVVVREDNRSPLIQKLIDTVIEAAKSARLRS